MNIYKSNNIFKILLKKKIKIFDLMDFKERFKGKTSTVDKTGITGVVN